jgi:hypothetical protein
VTSVASKPKSRAWAEVCLAQTRAPHRSPRTLASLGARHADRIALVLADLKQHPPRRRSRRDTAKQGNLAAQRTEI